MNVAQTAQSQLEEPALGHEQATDRSRWFWPVVIGICIVGGIIRASIIAEYVSQNPFALGPRVDAKVYWAWAQRIADGKLIQDVPFFSAPLYPYLLGLLRALGGGLTTVYIVQAMLDIATALLLARVCRRRFGDAAGMLAPALYLLMLEPASFSLRVLTCSLQLFLLVFAWDRLVAVQQRQNLGRLLAGGAAIGLLCLSYPPAMLLVPAVVVWLYWQSDRGLTAAGRALVPAGLACLLIAPATIHNWLASGDLFFIQSVTAVNLRQGNAPGATGVYTPIPNTTVDREGLFEDAAREYRLATGQTGTWKEIDDFNLRKVVDFWSESAAGTAKLAARKLYWFLTGRVYGDIYSPFMEMASGFADRLRLTPIRTTWLIGPAVVGLIVLLRRPVRHMPELLMFAIPLAIVIVFWYSPRYRLPAIPVIVGVAAWSFVRAARWRENPIFSIVTAVALAAAIATGPINQARGFDSVMTMAPVFEVSAGIRYEETGMFEQAREHYTRALTVNPSDKDALTRLGKLNFDTGRPDEAIERFRAAIAVNPGDAKSHANLAKALMGSGRFDEAIHEFSAALDLDPTLPGVRTDLARIHLSRNEPAKAIAQWQAALAKDPRDCEARLNLGTLYEQLGRPDDAIAEYKTILNSAADYTPARVRLFETYVRKNDVEAGKAVLQEGLRSSPDDTELLTSLAWLYATHPDPAVRNAAEAVRLAERACNLSNWANAHYLDVLAAAYAEAGQYDKAAKLVDDAIARVRRDGPSHILPVLQHRLQLYRSNQPFHWAASQR